MYTSYMYWLLLTRYILAAGTMLATRTVLATGGILDTSWLDNGCGYDYWLSA